MFFEVFFGIFLFYFFIKITSFGFLPIFKGQIVSNWTRLVKKINLQKKIFLEVTEAISLPLGNLTHIHPTYYFIMEYYTT
jgi:hypothetical protein